MNTDASHANHRLQKPAHCQRSILLLACTPTPWPVHCALITEKHTLDTRIWLASAYYKRKQLNQQSGGSERTHTQTNIQRHTQLIQQLCPCASHQCEVEDEVKGDTSTQKRVGRVKGRDVEGGKKRRGRPEEVGNQLLNNRWEISKGA